MNIACVIPVYNDWESLGVLIRGIEKHVSEKAGVTLVVVDDASAEPFNPSLIKTNIRVEVLSLLRNAGHQRAIAVGIQFVNEELSQSDYIVVLDSDGEDRPEDILSLVSACQAQKDSKVIFAKRKKRRAPAFFKTGYFFYKFVFRLLTGQRMGFGNFSCIPRKLLPRVASMENLWVHYSGGVMQQRIPFATVDMDRGKRYHGSSKMNSNSLILHGLVAISVYFDSMSVRILKVAAGGLVLCVAGVMVILYYKVFTDEAIPGWASSLILILLSIIIQLASVTLIVLLMQLSSRKNVQPPGADIYKKFISDRQTLS